MHAGKKERHDLLCEAYNELAESMEFLEKWGSQAMIDAFVDKLDTVDMALRLGNLLGVDLANDPWNEAK
jgi:hypothetical protein